MSSSAVPSLIFHKNTEKSKFSLVDRINSHHVEVFDIPNHISLSALDEPNKSKLLVVKDVLTTDSKADDAIECKKADRTAAKLALLADSKILQAKMDKARDKSKKHKYTDVSKSDASTDALHVSLVECLTKYVQTDTKLTPVKVNANIQTCVTENIKIIIKDRQTVHSINFDSKPKRLNIMLPDYVQKIRSNLISNRQLDVFKSVNVYKHNAFLSMNKFLSVKMNQADRVRDAPPPLEYNFDRVVNWISASNFNNALTGTETPKTTSVQNMDGLTDITSVTRQKPMPMKPTVVRNILQESDDVETLKNLAKIFDEIKDNSLEMKWQQTESAEKSVEKSSGQRDSKGVVSVVVEKRESVCLMPILILIIYIFSHSSVIEHFRLSISSCRSN